MDEGNHEWYYTRGADQAGPVRFEELKAIAAAGDIHPRADLVWHQGMDDWKPAGEIDGLFERASSPTGETGAARESSSSVPSSGKKDKNRQEVEVIDPTQKKSFAEFEIWPGASRRWYLLMVYLFPFVWAIIAFTFAYYIGRDLPPSFQKICILIAIIIPIWAVIDTSISRLSNLGMSKLWFLGYLIPVLNLWVGYRSFACPAGYAQSKKLDGLGWFLAIIYWFLILGSTASAILVPAAVSKVWNTPEFQERLQQINEQIEQVKQPGKTTVETNEEKRKQRRKMEDEKRKASQPKPAP